MVSFKTFLTEKHQLTHLDHLEDLVFLEGVKGAKKTLDYLEYVVDDIKHHKKALKVQIKVDGCVHEDTKIIVNKKNQQVSMPIGDYFKYDYYYPVLTYNTENEKVEWSIPIKHPPVNGNKDWFEIVLENNETIKLTGDHKVFTQRGWIETKDLTENDEIFEVQAKDYTKEVKQ